MQKVDCQQNKFLAEKLVEMSAQTRIIRAIADCIENYGIDDLWISAITFCGVLTGYPLENKTIKGGWQLKYEDKWNPYFETSNQKGIMKKLSGDTIPESGVVYFINSTKYEKLIESNACLCFLAPDGFILFGPNRLKKAYLGDVWYKNKSHTEEFGERFNPHWELKALIDLEQGSYYKVQGPIEIFQK